MRSRLLVVLIPSLAWACGDSVAPPAELQLASSYELSGVYRVLRDGVEPLSAHDFGLVFEELAVSGGSLTGFVRVREREERVAISGRFDPERGDFLFEPFQATLSSTVTELVQELGARGVDARPTDGIADEAPGYFRSLTGSTVKDGGFLGISRIDLRPDPPDETKIRAEVSDVGRVTVRGEAGSAPASSGVELYRFRLNQRNPTQTTEVASAEGSFQSTIDGLEGELFLIRTVRAGVVSSARAVRVTRP